MIWSEKMNLFMKTKQLGRSLKNHSELHLIYCRKNRLFTNAINGFVCLSPFNGMILTQIATIKVRMKLTRASLLCFLFCDYRRMFKCGTPEIATVLMFVRRAQKMKRSLNLECNKSVWNLYILFSGAKTQKFQHL